MFSNSLSMFFNVLKSNVLLHVFSSCRKQAEIYFISVVTSQKGLNILFCYNQGL
jgi:hypothetical protein